MGNLYRLTRGLLFALPPESAHGLAILALRLGLGGGGGGGSVAPDPPQLAIRLWGLEFANPIGIAAGFDKNGLVADALLSLGFGFTEVGTVTPKPQSGNPRPRLFRLTGERAAINRLGFNNRGAARLKARLTARRAANSGGIVGVNIGANRDHADRVADYVRLMEMLAGLADYFAVNISSPNTPGLRDLQERQALDGLLARLMEARAGLDPAYSGVPVALKISPDLDPDQCRDIADIARARGIDALIVANTTLARPEGLASPHRDQAGGLSGRPLMVPSTRLLAQMYRLTEGAIPLIGVGGVASGDDAYAKIRAGASLVQLYTALIFEGPALVARIKRDLATRLAEDGFGHLADAVGSAHGDY